MAQIDLTCSSGWPCTQEYTSSIYWTGGFSSIIQTDSVVLMWFGKYTKTQNKIKLNKKTNV